MLRRLEALLIIADRNSSLLLSGTGDLISPKEGVLAVGSGGPYALAAARALLKALSTLSAAELACESLLVASEIDIYTNNNITLEESEVVFLMPGRRHRRSRWRPLPTDPRPPPARRTPREIVAELDKFVIGQGRAKKAVAITLRNRWRRRRLDPEMSREILPKNILMIGPTGVGKTEIARRLARLADAPFLKVEA